jgi:Domain of unknown function (DUF4440)
MRIDLLKNFPALSLLILLPIILNAQTQDEMMLAKTIERLRHVMEQPDSLVLATLVSNNLEYVHSSGTMRDKKGFVDEFMKGWTKVSNVKFSNQTIKVVGDKGIVRHRMIADAHNPGYPSVIDIIILMVWTKEDGQWKMLARQAAKVLE